MLQQRTAGMKVYEERLVAGVDILDTTASAAASKCELPKRLLAQYVREKVEAVVSVLIGGQRPDFVCGANKDLDTSISSLPLCAYLRPYWRLFPSIRRIWKLQQEAQYTQEKVGAVKSAPRKTSTCRHYLYRSVCALNLASALLSKLGAPRMCVMCILPVA